MKGRSERPVIPHGIPGPDTPALGGSPLTGRSRKCPACGERISPATHIETPELRGPDDAWVGWCVNSQKHAVLRLSFAQDVRRTVRSIRSFIGGRA